MRADDLVQHRDGDFFSWVLHRNDSCPWVGPWLWRSTAGIVPCGKLSLASLPSTPYRCIAPICTTFIAANSRLATVLFACHTLLLWPATFTLVPSCAFMPPQAWAGDTPVPLYGDTCPPPVFNSYLFSTAGRLFYYSK